MRKLILSLLLLASSTAILSAQQYDLVLEGGRVMDPETGLDAVRNVGIRDGKIARISSETLSGRRIIHATGLVVAPGFIDLHQHAQDIASQRVKALDGVTTALEMEIGAPDVAQFLKAKEGHSLIHYGTSASHVAARSLVFGAPLPDGTILPKSGPATEQPATPEQIRRHPATPARGTGRRRPGRRHGHPVHARAQRASRSSTCFASPPNADCRSTPTCAAAAASSPAPPLNRSAK